MTEKSIKMEKVGEPGYLNFKEPHPSAYNAKEWLAGLHADKLSMYAESFASCSLSGNRLAEICSHTLQRMLKGEPVSDRYLLGLAWAIRNMEEKPEVKRRIAKNAKS